MPEISLNSEDLVDLVSNILERGNALRFCSKGGSMYPFIKDGDILEIKPFCGKTLRLTDIILYRSIDHRLFVHRVVGINPDLKIILAQGDALFQRDAPIKPEQILGHVTSIQRGNRGIRLDSFLQRTLARMWVATRPLRPYLIKAKALLRRYLRGPLAPFIYPRSR